MPFLDGTGPLGQGPMTGRGMGWCRQGRRGARFGYGWRRFGGWGWRFPARPARLSKEEELQILKEEVQALKEDLQEIEKQIGELEK